MNDHLSNNPEEKKMKKAVAWFFVLSLVLAPIALYADEAALEVKPIQFLNKKGYLDNTNAIKEPANVSWATGKGRKDFALKWAVDDNYLKKTPGMFLRGFSNAAFGWVEVLTQPIRWSKNAPLGVGTLTGVIVGPTMAVLRTTSGALDIGTCWLPFWHGVPMSKPALCLHDVHNYETVEDVNAYNQEVKRYLFN